MPLRILNVRFAAELGFSRALQVGEELTEHTRTVRGSEAMPLLSNQAAPSSRLPPLELVTLLFSRSCKEKGGGGGFKFLQLLLNLRPPRGVGEPGERMSGLLGRRP